MYMNKKFLPVIFSFSMIACQPKLPSGNVNNGFPDSDLTGAHDSKRVVTTAVKKKEVVTTKDGKKITVKSEESATSKTK